MGDEKVPGMPERYQRELDWQKLFAPGIIQRAFQNRSMMNAVIRKNWTGSYTVVFPSVAGRVSVTMRNLPTHYHDTWNGFYMTCTCGQERCEHMAAAFMAMERKQGGSIILYEKDSDYNARKNILKAEKELERRRAIMRQTGDKTVPAAEAFRSRPGTGVILFDMEEYLADYVTTPYFIARMPEAFASRREYGNVLHMETSRDGSRRIRFEMFFSDILYTARIWGEIDNTGMAFHSSGSERLKLNSKDENLFRMRADKCLTEYDLATISLIWDLVDLEGRKDVTDRSAESFFSGIRKLREEDVRREKKAVAEKTDKKPAVELHPRIISEAGEPWLSFKISYPGSKEYVLKSREELVQAIDQEGKLILGKADAIDFALFSIHPESVKLVDFIRRHPSQSRTGGYQVQLRGSTIDNFYDMYPEGSCEFQDKTNRIKDVIHIGRGDIRFKLTADRLSDARGNFIGVAVSGFVPVLIKGSSYRYVFSRQLLCRITPEEHRILRPFTAVADEDGFFRFQVGRDRLQEFYYRVIPELMENRMVEFVDNCADEVAAILPPEPAFTFYLDIVGQDVTLWCRVRYGDRECALKPGGKGPSSDGYRDAEQEGRVLQAIGEYFTYYDPVMERFRTRETDDFMYDFLTAGIGSLEMYGEVRGTGAFRARRVVKPPVVNLGVSVDDGGLMNITVTSRDLSNEELLAIYSGYTQKKRYYRLSGGTYIDLTGEGTLRELSRFFDEMDLTPTDVLRRNIHVPLYRALYLDRMLEGHQQLAAARDSTYRGLIRAFKTVRDADFETPAVMRDVLRPYQVYGYKWLRTLEASGFGGILADEMGLGKTVQTIALFCADKDAGVRQPSLVICPASLVYNWQEEVRRFAPELSCCVLAGTAGARKKELERADKPDLYITSYDLLKRDIALYETLTFHNCVLDEAQYIKNHKSAAAKSVKLVKARHRYALTGTPIENRLAELWSIFDFLMPGFLYTQAEFERRFAIPITKRKEEDATGRLKNMTGPFILRRRKADVLKDLPDKLEEVRMARLTGEQQRLYDAQVVRMKGMLSGGSLAGEEKIRIFAELTRIRQICCDPALLFEDYAGESAKREACLELIESAMEGGHRMLVFSQFVSMLELLEKDLKARGIAYYKIVGATPKDKRIAQVRAFNEGDVPVFLISLKAGGTGLNLTGADVVIHYDPWWNLAVQNQATDRAHRIGQTKQVTVIKLILKDTIEERIMALQNAKKDLAEAILEGSHESLMSLSAEELLDLLG